MRNYMIAALAATSLVGACKWTDFDDLEDTTWVRSTQDPELGSTDYAVAIAGVTSGTSGGTLAVVSDDTANYSLVQYNSKGIDSVNTSQAVKLGANQIGAIAEAPVFITDATGRIALVERSIGGNFAVYFGSPTAPAILEFPAAVPPAPAPDAAVFVPGANGDDVVFAAGNTLYTVAATGGTPVACTGMDENMMPLQVAALGHDGSRLWVWTKSGSLISFQLADLNPCTSGALPDPNLGVFTPTDGIMPAPGARMHISGNFAILTAHPTTSRSGSVYALDLTNLPPGGAAATLTVEGLRTSALVTLDGETYLVLGVPDRAVGGVASGEVDAYVFNTTTGVLDPTPVASLHDADPESGQLFGRTLTAMNFNGSPILVVGAKAEIFAYYRTSLYDQLP